MICNICNADKDEKSFSVSRIVGPTTYYMKACKMCRRGGRACGFADRVDEKKLQQHIADFKNMSPKQFYDVIQPTMTLPMFYRYYRNGEFAKFYQNCIII